MPINALSFNTLFQHYGENIDAEGFPISTPIAAGLYPFKVRVVVPKNGSPRHESFRPILTSAETVEHILAGVDLQVQKLNLYFPEMWMSPVEERTFMNTLAKEHSYLTHVSLMTQSYIMLTDFFENQMLIITV